MFYRIKYLLAATILVCISLPPRVAFSQSEIIAEKNDTSQQKSPAEANKLKQEKLRKKALQLYTEGEINYQQQKYQEALEKFQQALPILQEINDRAGESATLNYIGQIYINLKQYSKASDILDIALNPENRSVAGDRKSVV